MSRRRAANQDQYACSGLFGVTVPFRRHGGRLTHARYLQKLLSVTI
jgi:hypothetical protein